MAATRRLTTIFAADVAGYSRLIGADEEDTIERLKAHRRELIDPKIREFRGRIVKTTGDGLLAEFASVVDAMRCAAEVQRGMLDRDAGLGVDRRLRFRIGINLGDVIAEDGDILGDGVNIAARLEALAEPGGICVSRTVHDQVRDRLPFKLDDMGEQSVHNITRPVRAYLLGAAAIAQLPAPALPAAPPARRRWRPAAIAALPTAAAIAAAVWWLSLGGNTVPPPPAISAAVPVDALGLIAPTAPRLSIVVLPFANLSNDPAQEYLADGITEDLTTDLSRIEDSFVIARNTAFTYKNKPVEVKEIGRQLGVRYVLEGSVRRLNTQVRINVQLVDAQSGAHLWAERFDRDGQDLLGLETEITGRIARSVRSRMVAEEAGRVTDHPDALDYIFRGRAALIKPVSLATSDEAIANFERALVLDPTATRAQIGLASALISRVLDEFSGVPETDLKHAEALLDRALAAAPNSAWVHYVRGQLSRARGRCDQAIPEYEAAIALDRNSAPSYGWLGWCKLLTGDVDRTIALEEQAIRLSPQDRSIGAWYGRIGMVHLLEGRAVEAIRWLDKARARYSEQNRAPIYINAWLAAAHALNDEGERARSELEEAWKRGFHRTMAGFNGDPWYANPKVRALAEATYFVGLRKAGMPEGGERTAPARP
ncbi:MAG TPA: adenylate/guanylate cyclase domain-containing protein [Stellaceae bacterium]|nr:adenylate/guanylate cyclase domain-containing protein [Stellaceae bacterium]